VGLVPIPVPIAERFAYLPYIGAITALVIGADYLRQRAGAWLPAWAPLVAVMVAASALTVLTLQRHLVWKDNDSLWSATLADHPSAHGAMLGLAVVRLDQDRFSEAESLLRRALESPGVDPAKRAAMLDQLGVTYGSQDKLEEAVPLFVESLKLGEGAKAHYNLGLALVGLGRTQEGEAHLRRSLELNPYYARPYPILIELARQRGDAAEAERLQRQRPGAPR
jgi:tetratricopeptide (TPR) repeat protein